MDGLEYKKRTGTGSISDAKFEDIRSQLLSSTYNYEIVPVVEEKKAESKSDEKEEDITSQLLGCIDVQW